MEIIFGELVQGAKDIRERKILFSFWEVLPKINPDELWIQAGEFASLYKLPQKGIGLIDAGIIIGVKTKKCSLWTLDEKLLAFLRMGDSGSDFF